MWLVMPVVYMIVEFQLTSIMHNKLSSKRAGTDDLIKNLPGPELAMLAPVMQRFMWYQAPLTFQLWRLG